MKKWWQRKNWNPRNWKTKNIVFTAIVIVFVTLGGYLVYAHYNQVLPDSAIYFLNDVTMPTAGQKVLVFSPHPDDETIAAGGYIYDAEQRGAEVRIVLVTDGNKHGLKDTRYGEFKKSTGLLGVKPSDLVFLNYADGNLQNQNLDTLANQFKAQIDAFVPDIILYPNPDDGHLDHATTGKEVERVIDDEKLIEPSYKYLVHHSKFPQPKKYDPNGYILPPESMVTFDQEWQRFMLTPADEVKKEEAIRSYQSQLKNPFLTSLILSSIRKNELFAIDGSD